MRSFRMAGGFVCCLIAGAVQADTFPRVVEDDRERPFELAEEPERVVALAAFGADMMAALGRVPVGITTSEGTRPIYLGQALEDVADLGSLSQPNLELLEQLSPDLTIGSLNYNGPFEEQIGAFSAFMVWEPGDDDHSREIVTQMGAALGASEEAERLNAEFTALQAEYAARAGGSGPTFLYMWNFLGTLYAYQDNLMSAGLLSNLGAENLVGFNTEVESAEQAFLPIDLEELLKLDPEVLLIYSPSGPPQFNPVYDRLQAVQSGRAYSMGYQWSEPTGPIAREVVLREGAALLYPELFDLPELPEGAQAVPLTYAR